MADTPEVKVKKKVIALLKSRGAYYAMPVASGFGNAGVPDILACYRGHFFGIECKAGKGWPTALQISNLNQITVAGGTSLVINETNLNELEDEMNELDSQYGLR